MTGHDQSDPLIEEIHEIRRRMSERYGNDPVRLGEHYMEYQKKLKEELSALREARAARRESAPPDGE